MGKFISKLKVQEVQEGLWELTEPLVYKSSKLGFVIVDEGVRTDFASVPRLPLFYLVAGGKNNAPAALHDELYETKQFSRLQSDNLIFEAILDSLPAEGYSLKSIAMRVLSYPLAAITWLFVRLFGWWYWR